jgi:hypothetical protein
LAGRWLVAGAELMWEKSTAGWLAASQPNKLKIAGTEHLQMFSTHDARCVVALLHCSLVNFSCSGVAVPQMLMSPRARGTWGQDSWRPLHISSLQNSKVLLLQKPQHENWLSFHFCLDSFRKSAALLCSEKFCSFE